MLILLLFACSGPSRLAQIPGATRVAELANGELLVGTAEGGLWLVTSFGNVTHLADLPGHAIADLVSDPLGTFWARTPDGDVYRGAPWSPPERVATGAVLLVRRCDETLWLGEGEAGVGVTALSLGSSCATDVAGTEDGRVQGQRVTNAPVVRVQSIEGGVLWVDASGATGCVGCDVRLPANGVVDALSLHLAPFVPSEIVWMDEGGTLWITRR